MVFDDNEYCNYDHIIYAGDYNVPLDHEADIVGYLHVNNHIARKYIKGRMVTNELLDIWCVRNKGVKAFTFDKKQTSNRTKARLDYFLISQTTQRYITDARIGRASILSDHRPLFITISPAPIPTGRGFWRFNNSLLKDANFITSCNQTIKTVMKRYSKHLQNLDDLKDEDYPQAKWDISPVLLHDTILMEVRSFSMKYKAFKKKLPLEQSKSAN